MVLASPQPLKKSADVRPRPKFVRFLPPTPGRPFPGLEAPLRDVGFEDVNCPSGQCWIRGGFNTGRARLVCCLLKI